MLRKIPYICGPLTGLSAQASISARAFYERVADLFNELIGERAFVPHEHYDPVRHASFTPQEVDAAERDQICNKTSLLVCIPLEPSLGMGIELEMANQSRVPAIVPCPHGKNISRLFLGNRAVKHIINFSNHDDAIIKLREWINFEVTRALLQGRI